MNREIFIALVLTIGLLGAEVKAQVFPNYTWTPGQSVDEISGFTANGGNGYNAIVSGIDPYGGTSPIWEVSSQGTGSYPGFSVGQLVLSHNKTYRFSIWVKQVNSLTPSLALYITSNQNDGMKNSSGTLVKNYDITPTGWRVPILDKWYLLVGYVKANGEGSTFTGGIYEYGVDPSISFTPLSILTHELQTNITTFIYRPYIMNSNDIDDKVYFFDPRIDEVTDDDVSDLLFPDNTTDPGETYWSQNGNDINYTTGNVGIGTTDPGTWKLAVNGNIRAKEIKVETANWPDYVFTKDHELPSLEEVEKHIQEKGHLINIPSAADVELNGIELGEMNRLLLEKIEELTLYILKPEEKVQEQERKIEQQTNRLNALNTLENRIDQLERLNQQ